MFDAVLWQPTVIDFYLTNKGDEYSWRNEIIHFPVNPLTNDAIQDWSVLKHLQTINDDNIYLFV